MGGPSTIEKVAPEPADLGAAARSARRCERRSGRRSRRSGVAASRSRARSQRWSMTPARRRAAVVDGFDAVSGGVEDERAVVVGPVGGPGAGRRRRLGGRVRSSRATSRRPGGGCRRGSRYADAVSSDGRRFLRRSRSRPTRRSPPPSYGSGPSRSSKVRRRRRGRLRGLANGSRRGRSSVRAYRPRGGLVAPRRRSGWRRRTAISGSRRSRGGRASRSSRPRCSGRRSQAGPSCTTSRSCSGGKSSTSRARSCDRPMFQQALARCEARRDGRDHRRPARSFRPLGGGCARVDQAAERGRRAAGLGRGQLRRLDADGPVRDRDPDLDRRAGARADHRELGDAPSQKRSSAASTSRHAARPATARTRTGGSFAIEPAASVVAEVFRRRAPGASWARAGRLPRARSGVKSSEGQQHWSKAGVSDLVKNPRLSRGGPQRQGRQRRARTKPLVDPGRVRRRPIDHARSCKPRDGSLASQAMLGGLARCAGCGHTLKITGNTDKQHRRAATRSTTAPAATRKGTAKRRRPPGPSTSTSTSSRPVLAALTTAGGVLATAMESNDAAEAAAREVEAPHTNSISTCRPTSSLSSALMPSAQASRHASNASTRHANNSQALQANTLIADDLLPTDLLEGLARTHHTRETHDHARPPRQSHPAPRPNPGTQTRRQSPNAPRSCSAAALASTSRTWVEPGRRPRESRPADSPMSNRRQGDRPGASRCDQWFRGGGERLSVSSNCRITTRGQAGSTSARWRQTSAGREFEMGGSKLERFYDLVDEIEVAMMTTRRSDGHLESRAMANRSDPQEHLWFVAATDSERCRNSRRIRT